MKRMMYSKYFKRKEIVYKGYSMLLFPIKWFDASFHNPGYQYFIVKEGACQKTSNYKIKVQLQKTLFKANITAVTPSESKQIARVHLDNLSLSLTNSKEDHCQMIQNFQNKNTLSKQKNKLTILFYPPFMTKICCTFSFFW